MLDIKDKMDSNLAVAFWCFCSLAHVLESLVLMKLGHLKGSGVLPLGFSIVLVKLNSTIVILGDFIAILLV